MLYTEYLTQSLGESCHFCTPHDRVFIENDEAFLTYSLAPYHKHHLLVIPKQHKKSFMELTEKEMASVWDLIRKGSAILLELGYETYTVLVREGKGRDDKSVEHVHYHIIPENHIGDLTHDGRKRSIMTPMEIQEVSQDIRDVMQQLAFTGL